MLDNRHSTIPAGSRFELIETAPGSKLHWATLVTAALAALIFITTIVAVILDYTPLPVTDYWSEIIWLKTYYSGTWHVSDLWRQHNEHRLLFPRLFFITDLLVFRGTNVFVLCCIFLLQAAHAWVFIREVRWRPVLARDARIAAIAIVLILFFSAVNLDNLAGPFQIQFVMIFYSATLAVRALVCFAEEQRGRNRGRAAAGWLTSSFAAGAIATYSLASGVLVWPVLLLIGIISKVRLRVLGSILLAGSCMAFLYFHGYRPVAGHTDVRASLGRPLDVIAYVGAYLALPLSRICRPVGALAGLSALAGLAFMTFRVFRKPARRLLVLSIGVMWFIAAGAIVTALGRLTVAPPEAFGRYGTPASIFWVCAFLVLLTEAEIIPCSRESRITGTLVAAVTCIVTVIVPMHVNEIARWLGATRIARDATLPLLANVPAADQLAPIFPPDPMLPFVDADVLRVHRLSIFAQPAVLMGEALQAHHKLAGQDRCQGSWQSSSRIGGGERDTGWAWDISANRPPKLVMIADQGSIIRGIGRLADARTKDPHSSTWLAFATTLPAAEPYQAYVLLNDGTSVCPIQREPRLISLGQVSSGGMR